MALDYAIGGTIAVILLTYLAYALFCPERF